MKFFMYFINERCGRVSANYWTSPLNPKPIIIDDGFEKI